MVQVVQYNLHTCTTVCTVCTMLVTVVHGTVLYNKVIHTKNNLHIFTKNERHNNIIMSRNNSISSDDNADDSVDTTRNSNHHHHRRHSKRRRRDDVVDDKEKIHRRRHHHKSHSRRRERKKESSRRRLPKSSRRRSSHSSIDSSSSSSEERHERQGKRKKKRDREEKQYHEQHEEEDSRSSNSLNGLNGHTRSRRSRIERDIPDDTKDNQMILLDQLYQLFTRYPDLTTELPYFMIRMASGSSINLSQVSETDQDLVRMLETLFQTMNCTCVSGSREWIFPSKNSIHMDDNERALSLVRWVREELNSFGITMDKICEYELSLQENPLFPDTSVIAKTKSEMKEATMTIMTSMENDIACLTQMLLEEFSSPTMQKDTLSSSLSSSSSSSLASCTLAKELYDIFNMILQHEIVSLEGISDEKLKKSLEQLFLAIGLCREEMDDESENDGHDDGIERGKESVSYGYVLPESQEEIMNERDGASFVERNLNAAINACKAMHQEWMQSRNQQQHQEQQHKRILGPCRPPPLTKQHQGMDQRNDEDEEDDFGPDPFASVTKKRTVPSISNPTSSQIPVANSGTMSSLPNNKREEWMMQPGEHDFLKGVLSKGIKSRTFRNEKAKDPRSDVTVGAPLDPKIQKQVDDIMKLHEQARGPSLMEQHRERMEQKKREKNQKQDGWSWSREKDLDAGRRVDKSHLHMVMGGASSELKNKFQGSYSKTFD